MKVKVLATVIAVTFVMGAFSTADAGLFNFCKQKSSCCKSSCAPSCQTVSTCAPVKSCCAPRPSCCATRCGTTSGCAPAAGAEGAPESKDVESIPAPPQKDTKPPAPAKKADSEA